MEDPYPVKQSPSSPGDIPATPTIVPSSNNLPAEYADTFDLPPGYRFCPSDNELIRYYLKKKVMNQKLPPNEIPEVNLYKHNPEVLSAKYRMIGTKEWYFFTPRDRKYPNGNRPNRAVGSAEPGVVNGYWKATGSDREIKHGSTVIGFKKALVFYEGKPPKGSKTKWIMHEFRVNAPPLRSKIVGVDGVNMRLDDWVLCSIYKKVDKSTKKETIKSEDPESSSQLDQGIPPNDNEVITMANSDQASTSNEASTSYGQTMPPNDNDRATGGGTSAYYQYDMSSLVQNGVPISSHPSYPFTHGNQHIMTYGDPYQLPGTPSPLSFYYSHEVLFPIAENYSYNFSTWNPTNEDAE
ncbi:unnamed protein product [Cuscuta epithymum]|uniref:NAC domain-containing protein n=1 Tax=Cuscuta epithymum TaxID=186058 RepID=A0AAV0DKB8_9ASTE|nr:unnamed protein product [Cuscuta epithymum]